MGTKLKITHKATPDNVAVVDKIAYDRVYKDLGWTIVEDETEGRREIVSTPDADADTSDSSSKKKS